MRALPLLIALVAFGACGNDRGEPRAPSSPIGEVPAYEQRTGDPVAGRKALIEGGYVGCGVPLSGFQNVSQPAPESERLPDRGGLNAEMPYNLTAFTTASGVDVVTPNCLQCHAERINGELVIG